MTSFYRAGKQRQIVAPGFAHKVARTAPEWSCEAAIDCSPGRQPGVESAEVDIAPKGRKIVIYRCFAAL